MTLDVSPDLALPDEIVTESVAILGRRGSGKSNVAVVLAEEMFHASVPWVAVDPKGDYWGIRSDESGQGPGLPIPVFGGLHGDVVLESTAGVLVADLIVDENLTAVLDVSDFSKAERARFLLGFFDRLYHRHRKEPQPRHVILEEAHEFIPQQVGREDGKLKEAAARIVLQGRSFGLGSSVCSQRSARIHKDVLTQSNVLIAMQTTGPQDRKAIEAWVVENDADRALVESLPSLQPGEGWIWAPSLLDLTKRVKFRRRHTFDSGSTPEFGETRKVATIADVDTAAIEAAMADSIERAKADDPKVLRAELAKVKRELAAAMNRDVEPEVVEVEVVREVEVPVFDEDLVIRLENALSPATAVLAEVQERLTWETKVSDEVIEMTRTLRDSRSTRRDVSRQSAPKRDTKPKIRESSGPADESLSKAERSILTVLAQYPQGRDKTQLGLLTGYSTTGGGFNNALGSLRSKGYIEGSNAAVISATDAGVDALGEFEPLPTGAALREYWASKLSKAERLIFEHLCTIWPNGDTKDQIADATDYAVTGGGFNNALGRLRTRELIVGSNQSEITASDHLFDNG